MLGAVIVVVAMVLLLPTALFAAGAAWSALLGESLEAEARRRAAHPKPANT